MKVGRQFRQAASQSQAPFELSGKTQPKKKKKKRTQILIIIKKKTNNQLGINGFCQEIFMSSADLEALQQL